MWREEKKERGKRNDTQKKRESKTKTIRKKAREWKRNQNRKQVYIDANSIRRMYRKLDVLLAHIFHESFDFSGLLITKAARYTPNSSFSLEVSEPIRN